MPDTNQQGVNDPAGPGPAPREVPEETQMGDDRMAAKDAEEAQAQKSPRSLESPLNLTRSCFRAFTPSPRPC